MELINIINKCNLDENNVNVNAKILINILIMPSV